MVELNGNEVVAIKQFKLQIGLQRNRLQTALEAFSTDSQSQNDPSNNGHESDSTEVEDTSCPSTGFSHCSKRLISADVKDAIAGLLETLLLHRVARELRSRVSRGTVFGDLGRLVYRFDSDQINPTAFQPLVHTIVQQKSDLEIWKQVVLLTVTSSRTTPPPVAGPSSRSMPRTCSSVSYQGSEQTKSLLYDDLRDELHKCSYVNVEGFFEKYFDEKSWTPKSRDVFRAAKSMHFNGRWTTFPSVRTENTVWDWWSQFQAEYLSDLPGVYHRTLGKTEMTDPDGGCQLDLFVKSSQPLLSDRYRWDEVRVIGEHTESTDRGKKFLQLARYARNVFFAQPRRQFVHAFMLFHTKMELHVFDRSGTFSMEPFDIHEQPERFIRVISGYCMMSDEELGLDSFIERKGPDEYTSVIDQEGNEIRLQLMSVPIARRRAIVGRGTSCYCTADGQSVVKFSWVSATKSPTEPELLALANKRQVKGVPRLIGHRKIVSTGQLRPSLARSPQTGDEPFIDRTLYIQATQPAGRALSQFRSTRELLQAIRDAIKAHRSLFLDGKILHRDISERNIIITNPDENEGRFGMLIDVELGTVVEDTNNARTELQRVTGTLEYMAMEVLAQGLGRARPDLEHTYRHDLESFFYVFLSLCTGYGWEEGMAPNEDPFRWWHAARNYENMMHNRYGLIGPDGFEILVLPYFSPKFECVKDLAASLRDILFLRLNRLRIGTPDGDPSTLYNQMIGAFDKAIESC